MFLMESSIINGKFNVVCVCGGFGFPIGTASTNRIRLIGKCLSSKGIPFHVLHIGTSSFAENKNLSGEIEGITYEYLTSTIRRPDSRLKRLLCYLWGCILLPKRLYHFRSRCVVYVYYQGDVINLWVLWLCRLMKIPAVQEACEWWAGTDDSTRFRKWMYRSIMFRWSSGAMPISHEIQNRIRQSVACGYPLCRVPVLVDPAKSVAKKKIAINSYLPGSVLLWCGMVDGYKRDVMLLIDAMSALKTSMGQESLLRIVGPCSDKVRVELLSYASSKDISATRIHIPGFVSDDQLWAFCRDADIFLLPMWEDDRSKTRYPTKLGQYVAAGRPIITSRIGEMKCVFTEDNAKFYTPGDAGDLARCIDDLLSNASMGEKLALNALRDILPQVDYRLNAERITAWFAGIYSGFSDA